MKLHEEDSPAPTLSDFPSAQAHGGAVLTDTSGPVRKRKRSFLALATRVLSVFLVIGVVLAGATYWFITSGPIDSEQFRAQVETRLTALLGEGRSARLGGAKLSFGQGGMVAINATDVRILGDDRLNLGIAREAALTVKALPFLSGNVVVDKMMVRGASVSLLPFLAKPQKSDEEEEQDIERFLSSIDLTASLKALGATLREVDGQLASTGLDRFDLFNAKLLGFDELDLLSRTARLVSLRVERDRNFQSGLFLSGVVQTERGQWPIDAAWRKIGSSDKGGHRLEMRIDGVDVQELIGEPASSDVRSGSQAELRIVLPFDEAGAPQQGIVTLALSAGSLEVGADLKTSIADSVLRFQLMPEKNQIELQPSAVQFSHMRASAIGGVRFPGKSSDGAGATKFEVILNEVLAKGMGKSGSPRPGAMQLAGEIHADRVDFETLLLKTSTGDMTGKGSMGLSADKGRLRLRLDIGEMAVTDFKEYWPAFLAPGLRRWAREGVSEGTIRNAWVEADAPLLEVFGKARFAEDEMRSEVPIFDTSIRLPGQLPRITSADANIDYAGVESSVRLSEGKADLGKAGTLALSNGRLDVGDYNLDIIPAELSMELSGPASALYAMGTKQPLNYSKSSGLEPRGLKGTATTVMKASLGIGKDVELRDNRWSADVALRDFSARIEGGSRTLTKGRLSVKARPGKTTINGRANIDGVPADLAMVQSGSSGRVQRSATLLLDEKARAKMGINLSPIVSGPISVLLNEGSGGSSDLTVDLKTAKVELPWIGWSKGKGIPGTATMTMRQSGDRITISKLRLRGKGFRANGQLVVNGSKLVSGSFRDVRLNRTDDIDVDIKRTGSGFDVSFNGRSYDARSLILGLGRSAKSGQGGSSKLRVAVKGRVDRLIGFGGQILKGVSINMTQRSGRISSAYVSAVAQGNAPTSFEMKPLPGGMQTLMQTNNAGALLSF
ncbi:MAG: DUF3971 domain-containing protein, partial [Pseudomonadota bacterium]